MERRWKELTRLAAALSGTRARADTLEEAEIGHRPEAEIEMPTTESGRREAGTKRPMKQTTTYPIGTPLPRNGSLVMVKHDRALSVTTGRLAASVDAQKNGGRQEAIDGKEMTAALLTE